MDNIESILSEMKKLRNCTSNELPERYMHCTSDEKITLCGLSTDYVYPNDSIKTSLDCPICRDELLSWITKIANESPEWRDVVAAAVEIANIESKKLGN